ncbi:MAG: hypothetical protein V1678_01220 [Candidatus Aenigmatarchaeota archaeon]
MRLFKKTKIVFSKPPYVPDYERKEIIYRRLSEMANDGKNTRIGDLVVSLNKKYAPKMEFDSVKTASLVYELESLEKRVASSVMQIDGHLYYIFFPNPKNPIKSDMDVSAFKSERKEAVVYKCPFECGRYLRIKA